MEHTTLLEVVPINKYDLVLLSKQHMGGGSDLLLCEKLSSNMHFISPSSLQRVEISATSTFTAPSELCYLRDLVRYVVLTLLHWKAE